MDFKAGDIVQLCKYRESQYIPEGTIGIIIKANLESATGILYSRVKLDNEVYGFLNQQLALYDASDLEKVLYNLS